MNAIVARMLGEADHHSPEEKAVLGGGHDETSHAAEETKEVQLANQIIQAVKAGEKDQVIQLAQQLIKMHQREPNGPPAKRLNLSLMTGVPSNSAPSGM